MSNAELPDTDHATCFCLCHLTKVLFLGYQSLGINCLLLFFVVWQRIVKCLGEVGQSFRVSTIFFPPI